ncbi:2-C-methyl-D-erythritol 4-phosphate cytidylyltransferase [Marinigracilibium pacificum]|uniref:2-C-methyl-D-erythritol 4-phosphate cytidylyltransferase n=1 Tax=Marinigracilibium pacificum TaxID=2729599 RepID=A0A848J923_9BACT|nr:2-C-methyl-D-erythritol 4-phosphate cytidylyltransferase [Marinigracilibium pacificum]NMM49552.1 2-C-methyl-D-erythritol 4-phosphate cytidylyltransferase [Marinigracilibium pacificum]
MKKYVIIVAGGSGSRMRSDVPKQFLKLKGKPVLMHTIERFYKAFDNDLEIVVVLPQAQHNYWKSLCVEFEFNISHKIVSGGVTRMNSVENGLMAIGEDGIVAIHDGVRPMINEKVIKEAFSSAEVYGSGVVCVYPKDSLRVIKNHESLLTQSVNRAEYLIVQTPQVFRVEQIKSAFKSASNYEFTDDASVYENTGKAINIVIGDYDNIKITTPEDMLLAEALLNG